jgi:hypothetical protein
MAMTKALWSLNGLATELGKDRRTVAKALSNVPPDGYDGSEKRWHLTTALRALNPPRPNVMLQDDPFTNLLFDRLDNWPEIKRQAPLKCFSVEEIADFSKRYAGRRSGLAASWLVLHGRRRLGNRQGFSHPAGVGYGLAGAHYGVRGPRRAGGSS